MRNVNVNELNEDHEDNKDHEENEENVDNEDHEENEDHEDNEDHEELFKVNESSECIDLLNDSPWWR